MDSDKTKLNTRDLLDILLISLSASLFSGFFIDFIAGFAASYVAYDFDILSFFDISGVNFITENTSPLWYFDSQVSILLTKPIVSMFTGLFALAGLILIRRKLISFFFLLFWINLYAFNNSAGIIVDDAIARTGIYDVSVLFRFNTEVLIITGIIALYILYRIGMVNYLAFKTSIGQRFQHNKKNTILLFIVAIIIPWSTNFIIPMISKNLNYDIPFLLRNLSILVLFLPFFLYRPKEKITSKVEVISKIVTADRINLVFFTIGVVLLFFVLNDGVYIFATH